MATQKTLRDLRRDRQRDSEQSKIKTALENPPDNTGDLLAASELISETVEQGNSELRKIVNNTSETENIAAATELSAEATEISNQHLKEISDTSKKTFSKLSEFAEKLKNNFLADVEKNPITTTNTSDQTAKKIVEEEEQTPKNNPVLGYLKTISEDIKFLKNDKPKEEEKEDKVKPDEEENVERAIDRIGDRIVSSVDNGFKKTISIADSISSMLFKYTLTAVLNFAKMAALVLSLIMTFDVLSRHFTHWTKMFDENYAEFKDQLGSLATPFENIHGVITDLMNYFKSDEYAKMFVRLAEGAFDQMKYMVNMMMVGLAKLGATILRALGADEKADSLEASAISVAASEVGYTPSKEEEEVIGRVRKREAEDANNTEANWFEKQWRKVNGEDEETPDEKEKREKRMEIAKNTTAEQFGRYDVLSGKINHVGVTAKKNETSPELLNKHRELLDDRSNEVEQSYQEGKLTKESYEQLRVEIDKQTKFLAEHEKTLVVPTAAIKPAPEPEVSTVKSIDKEEKRVESKKQEAASQTNYHTKANIVKNQNQTIVQAPRTSSPGPGIGNNIL